jgi:hypothetical protein
MEAVLNQYGLRPMRIKMPVRDTQYWVADLDYWNLVIDNFEPYPKYYGEFRDCDDSAIKFYSYTREFFFLNSSVYVENDLHAFDVIVLLDSSIRVVEPQLTKSSRYVDFYSDESFAPTNYLYRLNGADYLV